MYARSTDLKRVVIASSVKAVLGLEPRTYTEDDWSDFAVKEVEEKGKAADKMSMYSASKLLAERGKRSSHSVPYSATDLTIVVFQPRGSSSRSTSRRGTSPCSTSGGCTE